MPSLRMPITDMTDMTDWSRNLASASVSVSATAPTCIYIRWHPHSSALMCVGLILNQGPTSTRSAYVSIHAEIHVHRSAENLGGFKWVSLAGAKYIE